MSTKQNLFGLIVLLLLSACNSSRVPAGSDAFVRGHVDGCVAGYSDAYRPSYAEVSPVVWRREQKYASNPEYRAGWDAGHHECYEDENRSPVMGGG